MTEDVCYLTIDALADSFRSGELTPTAVTELLLDRIQSFSHLRCYVHVSPDTALSAARKAEWELAHGHDRGPLHGVPIAFKDIFFNDVFETTAGLAAMPPGFGTHSSTVFERSVRAGAVILGSLVTAEGVYAGYRTSDVAPVNPWDPQIWPGASSSGAGVALSAGLCFGAYASDTGGSIRFPSAANGVTGLKPTWGRISRYGVVPLSPSLDHVGTMARTANDAWRLLEAVEGPDVCDPSTVDQPPTRIPSRADALDLVVGVDDTYMSSAPSDALDAVATAVATFEARGARIVSARVPVPDRVTEAWKTIASAEIAMGHREAFQSPAADYGDELAAIVREGLTVDAASLADAYSFKRWYTGELSHMFRQMDVLLCPVFEGLTPTLEEWNAVGDDRAGGVGRYINPFNVAGTPAMCIPAGSDHRGAPLSIQLCGGPWREGVLVGAAAALEDEHGWHRVHPHVRV